MGPDAAPDVHRPLQPHENLDEIFTSQEPRTLSKSLTLQYDRVLFLIEPSPENHDLVGPNTTFQMKALQSRVDRRAVRGRRRPGFRREIAQAGRKHWYVA